MEKDLRKLNAEYERAHGRSLPDHIVNRIREMKSKGISPEEQDRVVNWDNVPTILKPTNKIKGLEPAARSDPNRKKKVMITKDREINK